MGVDAVAFVSMAAALAQPRHSPEWSSRLYAGGNVLRILRSGAPSGTRNLR
jgi:hypothetical protein